MSKKPVQHCCERFKESVDEDKVIRRAIDLPDETKWYLSEGGHIYYCPFCGAFIKAKGSATTTRNIHNDGDDATQHNPPLEASRWADIVSIHSLDF